MSIDNLMGAGDKISDLMNETSSDGIQEMPLDIIDFDPNQPRKYFDPKKIKALGKTIVKYGVMQPITVRSNPDKEGHYLISMGERRYRASKGAGLKTIPVIINEAFIPEVQAVENIAREDLTLMERVNFISALLAKGRKQKEIAELLGQDEQWLSRHVQVIDAPEIVMKAIENGMIQSLEVAQTLTSKWNKGEEFEVTAFVESFLDGETATTSLLRQYFKKDKPETEADDTEPSKTAKKGDTVQNSTSADAELRLVKKLKKLEPIERNQLKELVDDKAVFGKLQLLTQGSVESMAALILYAIENGDIDAVFDQVEAGADHE